MIDHEQVHPIDEGWQPAVILDTTFRYRVLFEKEPNAVLNSFRNMIRLRLLEQYGYVDGENLLLYVSDDGTESDEAYLDDVSNLITMKLVGDEQVQLMISRIIKIEERE